MKDSDKLIIPAQLYIVVVDEKPQAIKIENTPTFDWAFPILVPCAANPTIFCSIEEAVRLASQTIKYAGQVNDENRFPVLKHGYEIHAIQSVRISTGTIK
jgi:hypothetical protein